MDTVCVKLKIVIALLVNCDIEVVYLKLSISLYLSECQIRRSEYGQWYGGICQFRSISGTNSGTPISLGGLLG